MRTRLLFLAALSGAVSLAQGPYTIVYTGKLMGYARVPDVQVLNEQRANQLSRPASIVAQDLHRQFRQAEANAPATLRLGMGDNFAPSFYGRDFQIPAGFPCSKVGTALALPQLMFLPKDRFYFDGTSWRCTEQGPGPIPTGSSAIDFDNVAQFFVQEHYTALVPGKHDFYFGPERLHALAAYMESSGGPRMLGANLAIQTTGQAKGSYDEKYPIGKIFKAADTSVGLPKPLLPWSRRFTVKKNSGYDVYLCPAPTAAAAPSPPTTAGCQQLTAVQAKSGAASGGSTDTDFELPPAVPMLVPGVDHVIVLTKGTEAARSEAFAAVQPYLEAAGNARQPWVLAGNLAVFGVVADDLLSKVGRLNDSWKNQDPKLDTRVTVLAADSALRQALSYCAQVPACQTARKVLMAQMPPARATQFFARFQKDFDAVLTEADRDQYTGDGTSVHVRDYPGFVLVPPDPVGLVETNNGQIAGFVAAISQTQITGTGNTWTALNRLEQGRTRHDITCPDGFDRAGIGSASTACGSSGLLPLGTATTLETDAKSFVANGTIQDATLLALRNALDTDVAILQKRDFFTPDFPDLLTTPILPALHQEWLERVLWKGDLAAKVHVTGKTLLALLAQSDIFDAADKNATDVDHEERRGLLHLGVIKMADDTWYVRGNPVDPAGLYTLATSDYIAFGDTGYDALAKPDVPPAANIGDIRKVSRIAGLVCRALSATTPMQCDKEIAGEDYFDTVPRPVSTAVPSTLPLVKSVLSLVKPSAPKFPTDIEGRLQQRAFWELKLEKSDIGFGGTYIRDPSAADGNFGNLAVSTVTTKEATNMNFDWSLRLTRDRRWGTLYLLSDSDYAGTLTPHTGKSLTKNMRGFESGGTIRLYRWLQRPGLLSFQSSLRYEGQITDPLPASVGAASGKGIDKALKGPSLPVPRSNKLAGRLGVRFDGGDNNLEFGWGMTDARNVVSGYNFATPAGIVTCKSSLLKGSTYQCSGGTATDSIDIASDKDLFQTQALTGTATTDSYRNGGLYLNANLKFNLFDLGSGKGHTVSLLLSNKGDLYFRNPSADTQDQTLYLDKFSPALSIPIYGKFAFSPKVDFILFENKKANRVYRAMQPSFSLSYTFDWRPGMSGGKALRYGAANSKQSGQ